VHPRIVAIGGGTGLPVVLRGLAGAMPHVLAPQGPWPSTEALTAIVTVTDDGGSSGRLRRDLGMLPPGDVRNCLGALAASGPFERLLNHRIDSSTALGGHPVGNLILAALTQMTGDFGSAIDELGRLVEARGRVYPATLDNVTLRAELASGEVVEGETAIVSHPSPIRTIALAHPARPTPDALRAIVHADAIVVGPGSLYTSLLPNLLVSGLAATLSAVAGVRIYVANLMTQPGETDDLTLADHLRIIRQHTGYDLFDYVLLNRTPVTAAQAARYDGEAAQLIPHYGTLPGTPRLVTAELLDTTTDKARHDPRKLAAAILDIVSHAGSRADRLATIST
jgi:uncharacterized cofD-like protein